MKTFKWHGIPVNIPSTYKEWFFFSVITIFSLIFTVYSLIISFFDQGENNENNSQKGGGGKISYKYVKDKLEKAGYKPIYSAAELKRISEEDLYKGLKNCDKKDLIKSDYEKRVNEGTDELGNEFDRNDDEIDSVGKAMDTPKLLYILMGSLIVVGVIESGFLDAPPCMTHTLI